MLPRDIYNHRAQWRTQQLNGLSPLQALLQKLLETDYFFRYRNNGENQVIRLFWAHRESRSTSEGFSFRSDDGRHLQNKQVPDAVA